MHADNLTTPLTQLEHRDEFIGRHIGTNDHVIGGMLATIGTASLSTLISETAMSSGRFNITLCPLKEAMATGKVISTRSRR